MTNPINFLVSKLWKFSEGNRKHVVLYSVMFVLANAVDFAEPLIVARLLNIVQEQGITPESMPALLWTLSFFIIITVGFWLFHGPARVIELRNAFLVRANYKKYLLEGTMALPAKWHSDHHSGNTIDKIEKSTRALHEFSGMSYEIIESIVRLVGSTVALAFFHLESLFIIIFMVVVTVSFILNIDKTLIKQYKELFKIENEISAKMFDVISNITTVIILRVEKMLSTSIMKKVMKPFDLFAKNNIVNETKWFVVSVCTSLMTFLVLEIGRAHV